SNVEDLVHLSHLHEAALLHVLQERFAADQIYTFTVMALAFATTFSSLTASTFRMNLRTGKQMGIRASISKKAWVPSTYATAARAYKGILDSKKSQVVLISGESGSGKTETTKYHTHDDHIYPSYPFEPRRRRRTNWDKVRRAVQSLGSHVDNQVLQTNPLLEAFGNAKTLRNDNSSRFGKFIELQFRQTRLSGARILTYLLEKVRVTKQMPGERTFHIMY
ncbi:unnamed protein product, partial [Amoebophrya sp. A25]